MLLVSSRASSQHSTLLGKAMSRMPEVLTEARHSGRTNLAIMAISRSWMQPCLNRRVNGQRSAPLLRPRIQRQQILPRCVFLHAEVARYCHLPNIFRDLHRAVLGAAHAAEVGGFERVWGSVSSW
jgi:hypothetical protein